MRLTDAALECTAYLPEQIPVPSLPEIIFSGRSNVGKSTLLNRLAGRKSLARTSSVPGKTASVNFFTCRCESTAEENSAGILRLVDLPGYGYARVSRGEKARWNELMDAYFREERDIRLLVQLVDVRRALTPEDAQMLRFARSRGMAAVAVMTKCDKLNRTETTRRRQEIPRELSEAVGGDFPPDGIHMVSTLTGEGLEALLDAIGRSLR